LGIGFVQRAQMPMLGTVELGLWGLPLSLVWVLGLTNVYNFMDGIDGLASSQAVAAGLGWAALGVLSGQPAASALGSVIAAGSLGFLLHNWPPARVFMGDVGSAYLGFTFAALTIAGAQAEPRLAIAGILLVWPFVFDAAFTILRRLLRRENVLAPHRTHLYQRLVIAGRSHRFVTCLYIVLDALGILAAVLWMTAPAIGSWVAVSIMVVAVMLWLFAVLTEKALQHGQTGQVASET
ncbi:MAG: MraY family glycosyltransferase, partial [Anaerolineae bacterium]